MERHPQSPGDSPSSFSELQRNSDLRTAQKDLRSSNFNDRLAAGRLLANALDVPIQIPFRDVEDEIEIEPDMELVNVDGKEMLLIMPTNGAAANQNKKKPQ